MELRIDKQLSSLVKFAAALTVALHHYSQYVCANDLSECIIYKLFSSQGGYLAVGVFFFLSGYGLMESEKKKHLPTSAFLKKRLLRVYLPALLVTLLWLPIKSYVQGEQLLTGGVIYKLLWGFEDGVLWFVKVLLVLYLCFDVFVWIRARYSHTVSIICLNLLTAGAIAVALLLLQMGDFHTISIPLFTIGVIGSLYNNGETQKTFAYLGAWCAGIICLLILLSGVSTLLIHALINYVTIFVAIFLLVKFPIKKNLVVPFVVGDISFDIYLVHNKALMTLKVLLPVVPLYYFVGLSAVATVLFYLIRKKLSL